MKTTNNPRIPATAIPVITGLNRPGIAGHDTGILAFLLCTLLLVLLATQTFPQDSITDYDGNVYHPVTIGSQVWLRENLSSLHYSDGTIIPGAAAYDDSDSMAAVYGRLYTWNAAMKNSLTPGAQGICPDGWHVPKHSEWTTMDNFLGGNLVAGGKLKEEGFDHWYPPNTGATNSSGFTALGAGEYDGNQSMQFQFLGMAAVFWTSTQANTSMAMERYLSYDDEISGSLNWYKTMKYSIRCIGDAGVGTSKETLPDKQPIKVINPFGGKLRIDCGDLIVVRINLYSLTGQLMAGKETNGIVNEIELNTEGLPDGIYFAEIFTTEATRQGTQPYGDVTRSVIKCIKGDVE
jgi:uncharacterized protein (TIGR02145 family)